MSAVPTASDEQVLRWAREALKTGREDEIALLEHQFAKIRVVQQQHTPDPLNISEPGRPSVKCSSCSKLQDAMMETAIWASTCRDFAFSNAILQRLEDPQAQGSCTEKACPSFADRLSDTHKTVVRRIVFYQNQQSQRVSQLSIESAFQQVDVALTDMKEITGPTLFPHLLAYNFVPFHTRRIYQPVNFEKRYFDPLVSWTYNQDVDFRQRLMRTCLLDVVIDVTGGEGEGPAEVRSAQRSPEIRTLCQRFVKKEESWTDLSDELLEVALRHGTLAGQETGKARKQAREDIAIELADASLIVLDCLWDSNAETCDEPLIKDLVAKLVAVSGLADRFHVHDGTVGDVADRICNARQPMGTILQDTAWLIFAAWFKQHQRDQAHDKDAVPHPVAQSKNPVDIFERKYEILHRRRLQATSHDSSSTAQYLVACQDFGSAALASNVDDSMRNKAIAAVDQAVSLLCSSLANITAEQNHKLHTLYETWAALLSHNNDPDAALQIRHERVATAVRAFSSSKTETNRLALQTASSSFAEHCQNL